MNLYQKINKGIKKFDLMETELANTRYLKTVADGKNFYVGGDNASDSNDGETPDKPFADINYAIRYISQNFAGYIARIVLQSDFYFSSTVLRVSPPSGGTLVIQSDNTRRTIRFSNSKCMMFDTVTSGRVILRNLNMFSDGVSSIHTGSGNSPITIGIEDVTFTTIGNQMAAIHHGSKTCDIIINNIKFKDCDCIAALRLFDSAEAVFAYGSSATFDNCKFSNATFLVTYGGSVVVNDLCAITGDATGRRYHVHTGSRIVTYNRGPNLIPGTEDGFCADNSLYC